MSSGTNQTTVQSDAELRVITVKTEAGDIVKFSGNPAELPGARYETTKALRRAGAFTLLVEHNASRLKNGTIAVDNVNNIPFVTGLLDDPDQASYTFEKPCPDTSSRITKLNAQRTANGEPQYTGADNIAGIPDKLLKLAVPNKHEVATEALAYALTQLSIFEDVQHANELLVACDYDGRKLAPLLDQIESQASLEDITLVTGRRNAFKEAGLRGLPLTFDSFRAFNKAFDVLEYRCPPNSRLSDNDRSQLVGTLFIKDPAARKNWSDHINQPEIINANGIRVSGPPRTYVEAKLLAEKVLRSVKVLSGIDELSSPSSVSLAAGSMAALMSDSSSSASSSSGVSAQQIFEALVTDPRKSFAGDANSARSSVTPFVPIDVPRGDDGKYLYWAPPMKLCDCGTPDEAFVTNGLVQITATQTSMRPIRLGQRAKARAKVRTRASKERARIRARITLRIRSRRRLPHSSLPGLCPSLQRHLPSRRRRRRLRPPSRDPTLNRSALPPTPSSRLSSTLRPSAMT